MIINDQSMKVTARVFMWTALYDRIRWNPIITHSFEQSQPGNPLLQCMTHHCHNGDPFISAQAIFLLLVYISEHTTSPHPLKNGYNPCRHSKGVGRVQCTLWHTQAWLDRQQHQQIWIFFKKKQKSNVPSVTHTFFFQATFSAFSGRKRGGGGMGLALFFS